MTILSYDSDFYLTFPFTRFYLFCFSPLSRLFFLFFLPPSCKRLQSYESSPFPSILIYWDETPSPLHRFKLCLKISEVGLSDQPVPLAKILNCSILMAISVQFWVSVSIFPPIVFTFETAGILFFAAINGSDGKRTYYGRLVTIHFNLCLQILTCYYSTNMISYGETSRN